MVGSEEAVRAAVDQRRPSARAGLQCPAGGWLKRARQRPRIAVERMPFLLRVELPDVPGSLGRVAGAIGEAGGDIEAIEIVEKRRRHRRRRRAARDRARRDARLDRVGLQRPRRRAASLWISRYAAGGNLFLDLEAVEDLTAHPTRRADRLVDLLPGAFPRRLGRPGRPRRRRPALHRRRRPSTCRGRARRRRPARGRRREHPPACAARLDDDEIVVIGRRGGPDFLDSELARLGHLAALAMSISRSAAATG